MFVTRLISGIILVILALVTIGTGGYVLFGTILLLSLIGMFEFYRACGIHKKQTGKRTGGLQFGILEIMGYLSAILFYLSLLLRSAYVQSFAIVFAVILLMFAYVFSYPKYKEGQVALAFFGVVYVAVMLSYIYQTRMLDRGAYHVWLIFLCSWGCTRF